MDVSDELIPARLVLCRFLLYCLCATVTTQPLFEMFIVPASISVSGDWEDHLSVKYFGVVWLLGFHVLLIVPFRATLDLFDSKQKLLLPQVVRHSRRFITDRGDVLIPQRSMLFQRGRSACICMSLFVPSRAPFDLCIRKLHVPRVYHGWL